MCNSVHKASRTLDRASWICACACHGFSSNCSGFAGREIFSGKLRGSLPLVMGKRDPTRLQRASIPGKVFSNLRSSARGQKIGRKKCFPGEVAIEMNTLKESKYGGEGSHTESDSNREVFRQRVWEFVSYAEVIGKLMCDKCGKEYIYKKCYGTHILKCMHVTPTRGEFHKPSNV